jgi:membrane-associated phospholipid phosphatase
VTAVGSGLVFVVSSAVFWIGSSASPERGPVPAWTRLSDLASWRVLPLATIVIAAALALAGRQGAARFVLTAVAGAGVLMYVARIVLQVVGADEDGGRLSDFPSGHATVTTALVGALAALVWLGSSGRGVRALAAAGAIVAVVAVGWARIASQGHSPLDVLGGVALGVFWLAVCLLVAPPEGARSFTRHEVLGSLLVLGTVGFAFLGAFYGDEPFASADRDVAIWVAAHMPTVAESVARGVTKLGDAWWSWLVGIALTAGLVVARRFRDAVWAAATLAGIHLSTALLKGAFDRPRPHADSAIHLPTSAAFPSGHAAGAVVTFGVLAALAAERWPSRTTLCWLLAGVLAIGVGASRVVLGVHYETDVLAGWCLGLAWLAAALLVRDALAARE